MNAFWASVNFDALIVSTPPSQRDYSGTLQFWMVQFMGGRAAAQVILGQVGEVDLYGRSVKLKKPDSRLLNPPQMELSGRPLSNDGCNFFMITT
jgi:hypothetical protein